MQGRVKLLLTPPGVDSTSGWPVWITVQFSDLTRDPKKPLSGPQQQKALGQSGRLNKKSATEPVNR